MYIQKEFDLIVTHDGLHHADDCLCRAITIAEGITGKFIRVRDVPPEHLRDTKVLVFDRGRSYNPLLHNFDHHQDGTLPAACILMLRHFYPAGLVRDRMEKRLFTYVSKVDVGDIVEEPGDEFDVPTFNTVIKDLNTLGFDAAAEVALSVYRATEIKARQDIEELAIWETEIEEYFPATAVYNGDAYLNSWREWAKRDGFNLLISKNKRGEGWRVESRDAKAMPIPAGLPGQDFRHNSGFVATYSTFEQAVEAARQTKAWAI